VFNAWPLRLAVASTVVIAGSGLLAGCASDRGRSAAADSSPNTTYVDIKVPTTTAATTEPPTTQPPTTQPMATTAPPTTQPPGRSGVFVTAPGQSAVTGSGPLTTYSVAVEESLGLDPAEVAEVVDQTLADPRSWTADGGAAFQRVGSAARIEILVASPATVDSRCLPLNTIGVYSCRSGNSVNINSDRWAGATSDWSLDLGAYRSYVVNHEVGHALGHDHEQCGGQGTPAPVMMQQSKGLKGCIPNPWPFP
jgi:hypothetical protein